MANVTLDPRKSYYYDPDGVNAPLTLFFPESTSTTQDITLVVVNRTASLTPVIFAAQGSDTIALPWNPAVKQASFQVAISQLQCTYQLVGTEWRLVGGIRAPGMHWQGAWNASQFYYPGDTVNDGRYAMVANKETQDRAAPQPIGSSAWILPTVPTWVTNQNTSVIYSGHRYQFTAPVEISAIRCWVPELTGSTNYRVVIIDNTDPAQPIYSPIEEPVLSLNDWTILTAGSLLCPVGKDLYIYLDSYNSGGDTIVTGGWAYEGPINAAEPPAQNWNRRQQNDVVRINYTDLDSTDRTSELQGVIPSSTIEIVETANPDNNLLYRVNTILDRTNSVEYGVNLISANGEITATAVCTINITIPIPQATKYVQIADHWLTNMPSFATVTGLLQYDGVDQPAIADDAFGIDINVVPMSISPDWDLLSLSP